MRRLSDRGTVLELCPSSNLRTHAVSGWDELREVYQGLRDAGVRTTINTDGTYLLRTTLRHELELLLAHQVFDLERHPALDRDRAPGDLRPVAAPGQANPRIGSWPARPLRLEVGTGSRSDHREGAAAMDDLLRDTAHRASRYLEGLASRGVAPAPAAVARLEELGGPLPDGPTDPAAVVALLDEIAAPATIVNAGGRYFGFVNGGSLPAALAANWLAGAWDQNAGPSVALPDGRRPRGDQRPVDPRRARASGRPRAGAS